MGGGELCDEYATKDGRIRVVHQENGGVVKARATGVGLARAEWIVFMDGDDTMPPDALETLYREVTTGKYDIVIGRSDNSKFGVEEVEFEKYRSNTILQRVVNCACWGRIFAKSLFDANTLDMPRDIVKGEDWLMNIRLAFNNRKPVRLVDRLVYNYRDNPTSCTKTFQNPVEFEVWFYNYVFMAVPRSEQTKYIREKVELCICFARKYFFYEMLKGGGLWERIKKRIMFKLSDVVLEMHRKSSGA